MGGTDTLPWIGTLHKARIEIFNMTVRLDDRVPIGLHVKRLEFRRWHDIHIRVDGHDVRDIRVPCQFGTEFLCFLERHGAIMPEGPKGFHADFKGFTACGQKMLTALDGIIGRTRIKNRNSINVGKSMG